jgi:hypothetical protein
MVIGSVTTDDREKSLPYGIRKKPGWLCGFGHDEYAEIADKTGFVHPQAWLIPSVARSPLDVSVLQTTAVCGGAAVAAERASRIVSGVQFATAPLRALCRHFSVARPLINVRRYVSGSRHEDEDGHK